MAEPTEQQVAEAAELSANPAVYWQKVHQRNVGQISALISSFRAQLDPIFTRYMGAFHGIVEAQSEELSIHRSFESMMRLEKGGEEDALAYLNALTELRQRLAEKAKAATEAKQ